MYSAAGETGGNEIRESVGPVSLETEFVVKPEIKSLIDSFILMGFSDLNNFGAEITSDAFFSNPDTFLLSSSIQATISDKMLNGTGGELIVPDTNVNTTSTVRLAVHADGVAYIESNEIKYILDGLDAMGLTDFTSLSFDPATIFAADFDTVLTSASLQATISKNILDNASDESAAYGTSTLIVPNALREDINVATVLNEQIEKNELKQLLEALDTLGFTSFGGSVGGTTVTSMTELQKDELFQSGSMHTTIDYMLRGNGSLVIPDLASATLYGIPTVTTEVEIRYFLDAVNTLGQTDFSSASFSVAAVAGLSTADRDVVATAMITRATLHNDVKTLADGIVYPYTDADYMNADNTTFFIKVTFLDIIETVYPAAS